MYKFDDKKFLYLVVLIILVGIIIPISFSIYKSQVDVNVVTKTGKMICDFSIDTKKDYIDDKGKFFYINVYNYEKEKDVVNLTDTKVSYKLLVSDKNNNKLSFNYKDISKSQLEITGNFDNTETDIVKYKVYINNLDTKKIQVNLNVKLEAFQNLD